MKLIAILSAGLLGFTLSASDSLLLPSTVWKKSGSGNMDFKDEDRTPFMI